MECIKKIYRALSHAANLLGAWVARDRGIDEELKLMCRVSLCVAKFFSEAGAKVIAVSDVNGGVFNPQGLDVKALLEHVRTTHAVPGLSGGEAISNEDLLRVECDILIPAALQCVITKGNASKVRARVIAEAANLPTTPEADEILSRRGVDILPDVLTNAGGVTVSYFEWA